MQGPLSLKNKMLSSPLLNISKASTPVRTRIISSNPNSTPINQLKFTTTVSRSPSSKYHNKNDHNDENNLQNKENINTNSLIYTQNDNHKVLLDDQSQKDLNMHKFTNFNNVINIQNNTNNDKVKNQ
jgi:hypothetical protein